MGTAFILADAIPDIAPTINLNLIIGSYFKIDIYISPTYT